MSNPILRGHSWPSFDASSRLGSRSAGARSYEHLGTAPTVAKQPMSLPGTPRLKAGVGEDRGGVEDDGGFGARPV